MSKIFKLTALLLIALSFWHCSDDASKDQAINQVPAPIAVNSSNSSLKQFNTIKATPSDQASSIKIIGRTQALQKIQIVPEVPGKALSTKKLLNEGIRYRKGETLVQIDADQYRLNLNAQKSQFQTSLVRIMSQIQLDYPNAHPVWDQYLKDFDVTAPMATLPEVKDEQLRYFLSANNVYASYYQIKSAEETLPKYQILAPFNGVITQGSLSPGAIVNPGQPIASYSRTDVYELKASISSAEIHQLKTGQKIKLQHSNTSESWSGTVHRIGATIDAATQAVPVFIRLSGNGLREGMFLEAELSSDTYSKVVALPLQALNRNKQVHLIQDNIVVLKDVEPVHYGQDQVWVQGLNKGDLVITDAINQPIVGSKAQAK